METCPCGAEVAYSECCEPLIKGERPAQTAEALMRSRFSAHVYSEVAYILETVHPDVRQDHDEKSIRQWCQDSKWEKFEIIECLDGAAQDSEGEVEFMAHYEEKGAKKIHHERAQFKKVDGIWYFENGVPVRAKPFIRTEPKIGRNSPCPCGSAKKYKKCCGA